MLVLHFAVNLFKLQTEIIIDIVTVCTLHNLVTVNFHILVKYTAALVSGHVECLHFVIFKIICQLSLMLLNVIKILTCLLLLASICSILTLGMLADNGLSLPQYNNPRYFMNWLLQNVT